MPVQIKSTQSIVLRLKTVQYLGTMLSTMVQILQVR